MSQDVTKLRHFEPLPVTEFMDDASAIVNFTNQTKTLLYLAQAIKCYQCKSSETIECSDVMINMPDAELKPESCDHVFEAEYCIKSTSLESNSSANSIIFPLYHFS